MLHSSRGPPDDRVEADVGVAVVLEDPGLRPVGLLDHPGGALLERGGQAALEHVGRLDEVVVDRDHGDPHRPGLGVGQQGCTVCRADARTWPLLLLVLYLDGSHES